MTELIVLLYIFVIGGGLLFMGWLYGNSEGGVALSRFINTKADILAKNAECDREIKRSAMNLKEKEWARVNSEL